MLFVSDNYVNEYNECRSKNSENQSEANSFVLIVKR